MLPTSTEMVREWETARSTKGELGSSFWGGIELPCESRSSEFVLRVRRSVVVDCEGDVSVRNCEDRIIAALTGDSSVASFGRSVDGIWRSSYSAM